MAAHDGGCPRQVLLYRQQLCNQRKFLSHDVEMNNKGILHVFYILHTHKHKRHVLFFINEKWSNRLQPQEGIKVEQELVGPTQVGLYA